MKRRRLSASLEDYVEAIYHVMTRKGAARAKDIAERLGVNGSSVTGALRSLGERGLVNYTPYDIITLTDKGIRVAKDVVRRHEALHDFFVKVLALEEADAEATACKVEHSISAEVLGRFIQLMDFMEVCPRIDVRWSPGGGYYCQDGPEAGGCEHCVERCLEGVRLQRKAAGAATGLCLSDLKPGQKARLIEFAPGQELPRWVTRFDVRPGAVVEVERVDPPGDVIEAKVMGHHLTIDERDAAEVMVELL